MKLKSIPCARTSPDPDDVLWARMLSRRSGNSAALRCKTFDPGGLPGRKSVTDELMLNRTDSTDLVHLLIRFVRHIWLKLVAGPTGFQCFFLLFS